MKRRTGYRVDLVLMDTARRGFTPYSGNGIPLDMAESLAARGQNFGVS